MPTNCFCYASRQTCSMGKGGILADDMGLGKTMQCSAFLAGALAASRSSSSSIFNPKQAAPAPAAGSQSAAPVPVRALIVAPKTLLAHWEKELRVCGMGRATHSFYSSSEGERSSVLTTITRQGLRLAGRLWGLHGTCSMLHLMRMRCSDGTDHQGWSQPQPQHTL